MKRLLSAILAVVLTASVLTMGIYADEVKLISAKSEINFSDVDKDTVAGKAIYKLANAGILVGDGDGTFRPGAPIKRAELCKIVNTIFGYTEKDTTGFSDVTSANWYYDHVLIAKKAGYIVGYDDGTFKGENYVTREQSCAILCRVAKLFDISDGVEIKDAVSEWAMPYVQTVIGNKLMSLEEGNTFRAQENIKRDEYSVVYANFVIDTPVEDDKNKDEKPSTGDKPSGGGSSSGGGSTKPSEPEIDYEEINDTILTNLKKVSKDITDNIYQFSEEIYITMLTKIYKCIDKVIADGSSNVIDRKYLETHYKKDIDSAVSDFRMIKSDIDPDDPEKKKEGLKKKFIDEAGSNLNIDTVTWLLNEFFGITIEELMD